MRSQKTNRSILKYIDETGHSTSYDETILNGKKNLFSNLLVVAGKCWAISRKKFWTDRGKAQLPLTVKYKRSAGLEALHFQFADMFVNVQFVSI